VKSIEAPFVGRASFQGKGQVLGIPDMAKFDFMAGFSKELDGSPRLWKMKE